MALSGRRLQMEGYGNPFPRPASATKGGGAAAEGYGKQRFSVSRHPPHPRPRPGLGPAAEVTAPTPAAVAGHPALIALSGETWPFGLAGLAGDASTSAFR